MNCKLPRSCHRHLHLLTYEISRSRSLPRHHATNSRNTAPFCRNDIHALFQAFPVNVPYLARTTTTTTQRTQNSHTWPGFSHSRNLGCYTSMITHFRQSHYFTQNHSALRAGLAPSLDKLSQRNRATLRNRAQQVIFTRCTLFSRYQITFDTQAWILALRPRAPSLNAGKTGQCKKFWLPLVPHKLSNHRHVSMCQMSVSNSFSRKRSNHRPVSMCQQKFNFTPTYNFFSQLAYNFRSHSFIFFIAL